MKIELKTKEETDYVSDRVTFEDDGEFVEVTYSYNSFKLRKSDLKRVINFMAGDE